MTNTISMSQLSVDQLTEYRSDEVGFLSDLSEVMSTYNILRVARFAPGDDSTYPGAYVLRLVHGEYVTHFAIRRDDAPGPVAWTFATGNYHGRNFALAVADLNSR